MNTPDQSLLDALLDSWDRNNTIVVNLLRAIPAGGLEIRAMEGSPTVAELFTHLHYVRLIFLVEDAPDFARPLPDKEWLHEPDADRIARMLEESAQAVRAALADKLQTGRAMDQHYDHPLLFLQHMIFHEGYHHGQIKLALKLAGRAITDEQIGRSTWGIWIDRR
ncbi:MAG: damage-inducible protein DinB [Proteobacteria bacterium]|nr:MAG: damage-inducible protein DinB [Pseudomonadota bacterium]